MIHPDQLEARATILVVDDEPMIRRIVRDFLQSAGYEVVLAENGQSALETYKVFLPPISVVLTDIMMDGLSGIELADQLHQLSPALPIIFMSGHIARGELGNRPLLRKPFRFDELKTAIDTALRSRAVDTH